MQEPHAISFHLSEALTLSTALLLLSRQGHLAAFGSAQLLLFEYPSKMEFDNCRQPPKNGKQVHARNSTCTYKANPDAIDSI